MSSSECREKAHPRARELMAQSLFWSGEEDSPFGSDEGWECLRSFKVWRSRNPSKSLRHCLDSILESFHYRGYAYDESMIDNSVVYQQLYEEDMHHEVNELDLTIVATSLAQLVYEGRIDCDAKPIIQLALRRQLLPAALDYEGGNQLSEECLQAITEVVKKA